MLKVDHFETFNWEGAIRGARNPMNSWDKSDSGTKCDRCTYNKCQYCDENDRHVFTIGPNDMDLLKRLRNGNSDDRKYLRQIFVCCDITAPLYWWKEMDQYKVATVTDSCSTMHKIASKPFEREDFSYEHLLTMNSDLPEEIIPTISTGSIYETELWSPLGMLDLTVKMLNACRDKYLETKDKRYWWQLIQLLPSSYNQKRTWTGNYENLVGIYRARHNHKLDEWHTFCDAIAELPYAKELIIREDK